MLQLAKPLAFLTPEEIRGFWELCRFHNNIGFWVVWLPTAWSIAMAYHAHPEIPAKDALARALVYIPLCFGIKSLIMSIDDVLDYDVDMLVERTKRRPIPRGAISVHSAWVFLSLQVVIGVFLAVTFLSQRSLHISMLVWPLYLIYPTCKRWTNLAPIPLGLMFNIGVFMGWSDLKFTDATSLRTLMPLYIGTILWTITYETVYQHQDKVDDAKIGLHSPALLLGRATIPICTTTAIGFLALLTYSGTLNGHSLPFHVGVVAAAVQLLSHLWMTDIDRPEDCKSLFLGTPRVGLIVLFGLVADAAFQRTKNTIPL